MLGRALNGLGVQTFKKAQSVLAPSLTRRAGLSHSAGWPYISTNKPSRIKKYFTLPVEDK